jgi:hypothetical protein
VKEKRDYESSLRSKGYPPSRKIEFVEDASLGKDEDLVMDKAAVKRRECWCIHTYETFAYFVSCGLVEFEIGSQKVGPQFAVGDGKLD